MFTYALRALKYGAILLAAFVALVVVIIFDMSLARVVLKNASSYEMTNITIDVADKVVGTGSLKPSAAMRTYSFPDRDGNVKVSFEINGKEVREQFGYVSANFAHPFQATVMSPDEMEIKFMPSLLELLTLQSAATFNVKIPDSSQGSTGD